MTWPSLALMNNAPSSALAADAAMNFKIVEIMQMVPLSLMGMWSHGIQPRKKWPSMRLQDSGAFK